MRGFEHGLLDQPSSDLVTVLLVVKQFRVKRVICIVE